MSSWGDRTLVEDLLARAVDDWVSAAEVFDLAKRSGAVDPWALRALAVGLIAEVLTLGLMVPGEYDGSGHRKWECTPAEAIARISEDWFARPDPLVTPGEIVWLDTTSDGEALGQAVLNREQP